MRNHTRSRLLIIGGLAIVLARPLQAQTTQDEPAPDGGQRPPKVAPLFEQPGVLTPRGTYVVEPALQYAHSSSDRIAFAGYALVLMLFNPRVDVREVRRNSTAASLTVRRGLSNRFELEVRIPYIYRSDDIVSRDMTAGIPTDRVFQNSGKAIGDVELAARYQLNQGSLHLPYFVGGVRFKSRTGHDPFETVTDCLVRCAGQNAAGTGLPANLATGSGFYALEPNIAWFMPANPATFFGTVSYMHNFKRSDISHKVLNGGSEPLGTITPPDSFGFNAGIGFALNDKVGLSFGYDHISIGRAQQNHRTLPNSLRMQLGTIMAGFSYRLDQRRTINVSIGGGLTRDAPDVGLMVRVPLAF